MIEFDKIHTDEKQRLLSQKMSEVTDIIHQRFKKGERISNCPICNSVSIQFFANCFKYEMDRCLDCEHIFTNPFPSLEALEFYYNSELKEFENKFFKESFENRIPIFIKRINEISTYLTTNQNLLDVGSAIGIFIEANFRSGKKFNITACDLNKSSCDLLKQKYTDLEVLNENIYYISKPPESFDAVSLWDTIEHLTHPKGLLTKIRELLVPSGYFFFSTPNTYSFEWEVMSSGHVQMLPPGHVNLYNTKNIKILLNQNGFRVIDIKTLNPSLDLSYIQKVYESRDKSNLERFFLELLKNDNDFYAYLCDKLIKNQKAGNMFVIAEKV